MTRHPSKKVVGILFACAALVASTDVAAQFFGASQGGLDCTIEPKVVAEVGSAGEGILEEVLVSRGDSVVKGQPLARLEARIEFLAAELARIKAEQNVNVRLNQTRLKYQRNETRRAQTLFGKNVVSRQALDEARIEEEVVRLETESAVIAQKVAQAERELAQAQLERRVILSPISGVVVSVNKAAGEYIHEQAPLLTLAGIDELHVEVFAPLSLYGRIYEGQVARVAPVQPLGGSYKAVVEVIDRVFDAASNTFGVRLRLPNADRKLPAGIRCSVELEGIVGEIE